MENLPNPPQNMVQPKQQTKRKRAQFQTDNSHLTENEPPKKVRVTKAVKPTKEVQSQNIIHKSLDEEPPASLVTLPRDVLLVSTRQDLDEFIKRQTGGRKLTREEKLEVSRQRKLIKNRKSASASRKRKKEHLETLEENHRALMEENAVLKEKILQLEMDKSKMSNQVSFFSKLCDQYPIISSAYDQYTSMKKQNFSITYGMKQAIFLLFIFQLYLAVGIYYKSTQHSDLNTYASKQLQFLDYYNVNNNNNNYNSNIMSNYPHTDNILSKHTDLSSSKITDFCRSNILDHSFLENDKFNFDSGKEFGLVSNTKEDYDKTPSDLVGDKTSLLDYFNDNSDFNTFEDSITNRTVLLSSTNFLEELERSEEETSSSTESDPQNYPPELETFSEILSTNATIFDNEPNPVVTGENIFYDSTPYNISFILAGNLDFTLDEAHTPNNRCIEF